ncbi:VIR protein [Plasmodium vivax]|uniref:VIR protein n=1 Tax=Plasmodium vivax TaxID=5855 RepID=A0A1G4EHT3_PLAVI|nr:VIR protein [Plasmodium vivax]VUZ99770.1 PIR protein [Plasmodium vivax]
MDPSHDKDYYDIVHLFPTGEGRFDISNISYNYEHFSLCNLIGPTDKNEGLAFINPCMNVAKYLEDSYTKLSIKDEIDRCKYLNYSINDIVKNDVNHNYNKENFIQAYDKLATRLSECKNKIKSIENSVFDNVKLLANIYYNFNKYINAINTKQATNCEDVYRSVQLYMNNAGRCTGVNNNFCVAVDNFKNYYQSKISQVNCVKKKSKLKSFLSLDDTEAVTVDEEGREELNEKAGKDLLAAESESVPLGQHVTQAALEENPESTPDPEMFKTTEGFNGEDTSVPDIAVPPESIMNKNVSTIGATFAGSSLFLVMMYKYTPLGSWVSTKILGRNKLMENMEKNYEFILNNVGNRETSLNDPMYNIRYNSTTNH